MRHLAATYTAGIVRNHPFIDGNKRTGESAAQAILSLAAGTLDEPALAAWLRANVKRP